LRVQLKRAASAAVLLLACAAPGGAGADNAFTAKTQLYLDSDHTTVVSPLVAISRDAWSDATLSASYVADIVTSASVDVISNATRRMTDFRSELSAGLSQKVRSATLSGSYVYSVENDYASHNVELGLAQELLDKNSTLSLGWSLSSNRIGRSGDQLFRESLFTTGAAASWTQVIDKKTIAQLSYTFSYANGFQSSPYRFVRFEDDRGDLVEKHQERDPRLRYRHAAVIGLNRHLFKDSAIQGDYRFYDDNWGVQAHTLQVRYFITFRDDLTLRLRERFYYQSGASFYRQHYVVGNGAEPDFFTADRELSRFWSNLIGAKISWRLPWVHRALELEAKVDYFHFRYLDFALLASRDGVNVEAGLNVRY
jgi:hypothetical protein